MRLLSSLVLIALLLSTLNAQITLNLRQTYRGTVLKDQVIQYMIPKGIPDLGEDMLEIVLSPFSGDCDIYASMMPNPSRSSHTWKSNNQAGVDLIELKKDDPRFNPKDGPVYVAIDGALNCEYTLYARITRNTLIVEESLPQMMRIQPLQYVYFRYELPAETDFWVYITTLSGERPDCFVGNRNRTRPTASSNDWAFYGYDGFAIKRTDNGYTGPGPYYFGVYNWASTRQAYISFQVSSYRNATTLPDGFYAHQELDASTSVWFKYKMVTGTPFKLSLNVFSGFVNLYVATYPNRRPGPGSYTWTLQSSGQDTLVVKPSDNEYKDNTWWYVGARGVYDYNEFHVTAATDAVHTALVAGRAQQQSIGENGQYHWFYFYNDVQQNALEITATETEGEVTMYSATGEENRFPTYENYEKSGVKTGRTVNIEYMSAARETNIYIGVRCERAPCTFSITVNGADIITRLLPGKPEWITLRANSYRRFSFDNNNPKDDVSFQATGGGTQGPRIDVYVAYFPPTRRNYTWAFINRWGGGAWTIYANDPNRKTSGDETFYISAYYRGRDTQWFSFKAWTSATTNQLFSGDSFTTLIRYDDMHYYKYRMPNSGHLTIRARPRAVMQPFEEPVIMFVSQLSEKPGWDDYQWLSRRQGDEIVVPIDDAWDGWYYIGVLGQRSPNVTYTITVSNDYELIFPYASTSLWDRVRLRRMRYFTMDLEKSSANENANSGYGVLGVTLLRGVTELYVSFNSSVWPTRRNYDARSTGFPSNTILFNKKDPKFQWTRWNIGVYGVADSEFIIRASFHSDYQAPLVLGVPSVGVVGKVAAKFICAPFTLTTGTHIINFKYLRRNQYPLGPYFSVYASQIYQRVNSTRYTWKIENWQDNAQLVVNITDTFRTLTVVVESSEMHIAESRIMATIYRPNAPYYLTQERTHERYITPDASQLFTVPTNIYAKQFLVSVDSCDNSAPPAFYVSRRFNKPNETHGWKSRTANQFSQNIVRDFTWDESLPNYYMALQKLPYAQYISIYATLNADGRPIPGGNGKLTYGEIVESSGMKHFMLTFARGDNDALGIDPVNLRYFVFARKLKSGESIKNVNMYTDCSIAKQGVLVKETSSQNGADFITTEVRVEKPSEDTAYIFNVVVANPYGHHGVYEPFVVTIPGGGYLGSGAAWGVVPLLLILGVIGVIAGYLIIGVLVKKFVYGASGLDLIPNIGFWSTVFGWIKSIFTCGRSGFAQLVDETDAKGYGGDVKDEIAPAEQTTTSGYGTV